MKGIAVLVLLIAVQATVATAQCSQQVIVRPTPPPKTCGTIPYITDLSKACVSRTTEFSGLLVKIVASLEALKTCEISSDAQVLVVNLKVYLDALIVQVLAGVNLVQAACEKGTITTNLKANITQCHKSVSVLIGFAGSTYISTGVWVTALIEVNKNVKDLVTDVNTVIKLLSVKESVLLTEIIIALVVLLHAVVFAVGLVVVQLTAVLSVAVSAVVSLLTGTLTQSSTSCGGLVVKVTSCVSTGVNPVTIILVNLAALIALLVAGVKLLLSSVVSLISSIL